MGETKIAFVADVHVGNPKKYGGRYERGMNSRCRAILGTLERSVQNAVDHRCEALVILGDLFDGVRPTPQMVAEVQRILRAPIKVICLLGNHEFVSTLESDHSLAPLWPVVEIVDRPLVYTLADRNHTRLVLVPFRPGPAMDWLPAVLEEEQASGDILCLHLGISDSETPGWLAGAHDSIGLRQLSDLLVQHHIRSAVAGNWHEMRSWPNQIHQVGCLCPTGWNNPGFSDYGWMAIAHVQDGDILIRSYQVPGPRFVQVTSETAFGPKDFGELAREAAERGCELWLEVRVPASEVERTSAELVAAVERGDVAGGGVLAVSDPDAAKSMTKAAAAASSAETISEALAAFVAKMSLPDGIDPVSVLEKAKEYLNG